VRTACWPDVAGRAIVKVKGHAMIDKSTNKTEGASGSELPLAKKAYEKPVLTKLGALRDLTMTLNSKGNKDGKNSRFTGRGGHRLVGDLRS
jgi:hypothetical protein